MKRLLILLFLSGSLSIHSAGQIRQITLAVVHEVRMETFYSQLFEIDFSPEETDNYKVVSGEWNGITLTFCPAEIAGNSAKQNRHQLHIQVKDVDEFFEQALKLGAIIIERPVSLEGMRSGSLMDPDGTSMVICQKME